MTLSRALLMAAVLSPLLHVVPVSADSAAQSWGRIANPGFVNQPMKSVYFFAGDWRGPAPGGPYYDGLTPATNDCLYTLHPLDADHLGWSESRANRDFAVNSMLAAGVNVVTMSYWSPAGDDAWASGAPMQTAIGAHNELFDAAGGKPMLILPAIEEVDSNKGLQQSGCHNDFGPVGHSDGYHFRTDFPGPTPTNPAPGLVLRIKDLVTRYLKNPAHPEWADRWVKLYDKDGTARYAISIIHAGSDQLVFDPHPDATFANALQWVADKIAADEQVAIGFTLDAIPAGPDIPLFKVTPETTAVELAKQPAFLGLQAFIPELFTGICSRYFHPGSDCDKVGGSPALTSLIDWKRGYVQRWVAKNIPVILDVAPGYDAHIIFGTAETSQPPEIHTDVRYGNTATWRDAQTAFLGLGVVGLTGNTWNGFTEGYAIMPSCGTPPGLLCVDGDPFDATFTWFRGLVPPGGSAARTPLELVALGPASGVYSDPVALTATLTEGLTGAAVAGRSVQFKVGAQSTTATTNAAGVATATITLDQAPAALTLDASFAGDATYLSIAARVPFTVLRETTAVRYTGAQAIATGSSATLSAVLADDDGQPVDGRQVAFVLGAGAASCTATTDGTGVAQCTVAVAPSLGSQRVSVAFAGDAYYAPSQATTTVIVFAYLPQGAFVIADANAMTGAVVEFWGNDWSKRNPAGNATPASFKGFASDVGGVPPRCGVAWSSATGNSPPPPAGPLPSYMAVSATVAVRKAGGASVSGDTHRIVVVRTNAGYAPDPAYPGTGTVVATLCGP
jgi:hypothetical protein